MPGDPAHDSAHPAAGHQLAQAPGGAAPIGRVETVAGTVTAQHPDGTVETLAQGASVYQRDLIATQAGAKVALVFADKTTFALGESGQMRLDEMIYDPSHKDGKIALSMLKGAFAFVSGDIAATQADAMTVRTPVGTIGIRGTAVTGNVDPGGNSTFSAVPDPSGAHSTVAFTNGAGTEIVTENFTISVSSFFSAPSAPFASPGGSLGELGALMAIAGAIASTINPGGSTPPEGASGPTTPQSGQGPQGAEDHTPLIHVSVSETYLSTGPELVVTFDYQSLTPQYVSPPIPTYLTVPPSPTPSTEVTTQAIGFLGTLGVDHFVGTAAAELFNFSFTPNSLQSGDYVDGGGGNDTLTAAFNKAFSIDATLTIKNVPNIQIALGGSPNFLDAANITVGPLDTSATITVTGDGALTVTDLQVNLDGHAMTGPLTATATPTAAGIVIEGGAGANSLTGAGFGQGDVLSYQHAAAGVTVNFAAHSAVHGGATDTIGGFDAVRGSAFSDSINVSLTGGGHSFTVEGGAGNNTLTGSLSDLDTLSYAHAPGGATVDFSAGTASNGYGGSDVFSGFSGAIGSAFDDSFTTTDTTHTIIGGGGNDTVSVDGTINNLTLINIKDVIGINPGATGTNVTLAAPPSGFVVDLTGSGGNDTVGVLGGNGGSISVGSGDDAIAVVGSSNTITAGVGGAGALDVLNVVGSANTITVDPTGGSIGNVATVGVVGNSNMVTVGNGGDLISVTMTAIGSSNTITVGNGDDAIGVIGNSNSIHFGTGSDTISVSGDDNVLVDGAPLVRDVVTIAGNSDQLFLSGGKNHITVVGADDLISITGGDDSISVGGGSVTVDFTTLGNDPISFTGTGASAVLNFQGSSDDVITMVGSDNAATINGGNATITINDSGAGNAVSALSDDLITVNMSGTNSSLSLVVSGDVNINVNSATSGDTVTVLGSNDAIFANSVDDAISVGGGNFDAVFPGLIPTSGPHNDLVTLSGGNDTLWDGSDDTITASLTGTSDVINFQTPSDDTLNLPGSGESFTISVLGGLGVNDSINASGSFDAIDIVEPSGTGSFAIAISGHDDLISAGDDDLFTITGNNNVISVTGSFQFDAVDATGTGDRVFVTGSDDVINAGALGGENFLVNVTGADDGIGIQGSNDTITAILGGTADSVVINGQDDFLSLTGNFETFTVDISAGNATTHASGDTIDIGGAGGGNHDMITVDDSFSVGIQLYGSDDFVSISTGGDAVNVSGSADTVSFGFGCGNAITLFGSNDTLTVTGSESIAVSITGSADTVTVDVSNHNVSVSGLAGDIFSVVGNGDGIDVVGGSFYAINVTTAGDDSFDAVFIQNGDDSIALSISMAGNDDSITVAANDDSITASLGGADDTISASGDGDIITLPTSNVALVVNLSGCDDSIALSGGNDTITANFTGVNDVITVSGNADIVSVSGNFETVVAHFSGVGDALSASGSDDNIGVDGAGGSITVPGGHDFFVVGGTSEAISVTGTYDTISTSAGNDTIVLSAFDDAVTIGGGNEFVLVTGNSAPVVVNGSDDALSIGTGGDMVQLNGGADSLTGTHSDMLDYGQAGQPATMTITGLAAQVLSGTATGGSASADHFSNFGSLNVSGSAGGNLVIAAGATGVGGITSISLASGTISAFGCNVSISGFTSVTNQSGIGLNITGSGADDTITGGSGGNTLTADSVPGSLDNFNFVATTDSFSTQASTADGHTDQIFNFQDSSHTIDFRNLAGAGTETFAGLKAGASFAAAFGADAANTIDYAQIGGNTFIHVAGGGGGYSAGDLLIELQGAHTLTAANFHPHP